MMLRLSELFSSIIIQYLVIARVARTKEKTVMLCDLSSKVRISAAVALVDSCLVFGVSFFSALLTLGSDDPLLNIRLAFYSAFVMSGLSFSSEMRKLISNK